MGSGVKFREIGLHQAIRGCYSARRNFKTPSGADFSDAERKKKASDEVCLAREAAIYTAKRGAIPPHGPPCPKPPPIAVYRHGGPCTFMYYMHLVYGTYFWVMGHGVPCNLYLSVKHTGRGHIWGET